MLLTRADLNRLASQTLVRIKSHEDKRSYLGVVVQGPFSEPDAVSPNSTMAVGVVVQGKKVQYTFDYHGRAEVEILGEESRGNLVPPRYRPRPKSPVYVIDEAESARILGVGGDLCLGQVVGYQSMEAKKRVFYEYHSSLMEPWDGPAALAFSDGRFVGCALDRNGLRPCRYKITRDGLVVAGSEVGLVDLDPREVVECGKVGPGEVLVVDTASGEVVRNLDAKRRVASRRPYARWGARYMATLVPDPARVPPAPEGEALVRLQRAFGYGSEDLRLILEPMGSTSADPVWSMGDDTPIPPLSVVPQSVYAYFRQRFAQVTNPPIDPLRESMVMSLRMHLGRRGSPLLERPSYARMLRLEHPLLLEDEMAALRNVAGFSTVTLDAVGDVAKGVDGLRPALPAWRRAAERAARFLAKWRQIKDRLPLARLLNTVFADSGYDAAMQFEKSWEFYKAGKPELMLNREKR